MILPGQMIRMRGIFSPFSERGVHDGLSYGLSCAGYDIRLREEVIVVQGYTTLGCSLEYMSFPPDLLGLVKDKSTWARQGLQVQNTVIECGFEGVLALELSYAPLLGGPAKILIRTGTPIAQVLVYQLMAPAENPYQGKYQRQKPNDLKAKLEK